MLSSEGALPGVMHKLPVLGSEPFKSSVEKKVSTMSVGIHEYLTRIDRLKLPVATLQREAADSVLRLRELYARVNAFDTFATQYRTNEELEQLGKKIKRTKLDIMVYDGEKRDNARAELAQLEKEQLEANAAQKELSKLFGRHLTEGQMDELSAEEKRLRLDVLLGSEPAKVAETQAKLAEVSQTAANSEIANTFISTGTLSRKAIESASKKLHTIVNEAKEKSQTQIAGYLFFRNKQVFLEHKSANAFDPEKEARQIEGVSRALQKQHLQMGTGEGKSTVVIPISALVDAATNGDGRVVVGSANSILVSELQQNTEKLAEVLRELPIFANSVKLTHESDTDVVGREKNQENILRSINRDILTTGEIRKETKQKLHENHWNTKIISHEDPNETVQENGEGTYLEKGDGKQIKIFFADEQKLVFDWMENKKVFEDQCPQIFMDEAHVPYDKKTPYSLTNAPMVISNQEVRAGVSDWIARYIVAQHIKPEDVTPDLGQDAIKDAQQMVSLRNLDFDSITVNGKDELSVQFRQAVDIIIDSLGESPKERSHLQKKLLRDLQSQFPKLGESDRLFNAQRDSDKLQQLDKKIKETQLRIKLSQKSGDEPHDADLEELIQLNKEKQEAIQANEWGEQPDSDAHHQRIMQDIITDVVKFIRLKDKEYVSNKGGLVIRDSYVDELMESHKYKQEVQATVLAITGRFEPIRRKVAFKTVTYPSFLHAVRENIVAFSGTLMYPDPHKARMKKASFAKLLEKETGRSVHVLSIPEIKPIPQPNLVRTRDELRSHMARELKSERFIDERVRNEKRPTLIVDFGKVTEAMTTFERMKDEFGEDRVRFIGPKPSSGEPATRYQHELDEYRKQLANGEIDILVSSGSAALGVNFEKSDGSFPDLRTISLGLPDSEERLAQTIGRRRMTENSTRNHLWYVSLTELDHAISLLQSESHIFKFDWKKTREQMQEALETALDENDRRKTSNLIFSLMSELRGSRNADETFQQMYDALMEDSIIPEAEKYMKHHIASELLRYDDETISHLLDTEYIAGKKTEKPSDDLLLKSEMLEAYFTQIGLPSSLHSDILKQEMLAQLQQRKSFSAQYEHERLAERIRTLRSYVRSEDGFRFHEQLDQWFEASKQAVADYARIVDFKKNIPQLHVKKGMKVRFAILSEQISENQFRVLDELSKRYGVKQIAEDEQNVIYAVPSGNGDDGYLVVMDKETGVQRILYSPQMQIGAQPILKTTDFKLEKMNMLTLGLPSFGNVGGITKMPLYKVTYTPPKDSP